MHCMCRKTILSSVVVALAGISSALVNVAGGKPVTLNGTFGELRDGAAWSQTPLADASSIVDGVFLPEQTDWNDGSVWWDNTVQASMFNSIVIDFLGTYHIDYITIQADNNDYYGIEYLAADDSWVTLGAFTNVSGYGLITRGPIDLAGSGLDFTGKAIRISTLGNGFDDGYVSISEFQALGESAVPGPAAAIPAVLGLGVTALRRRRK